MEFPVFVGIGELRIHPHLLFESFAYFVGFRTYLALRRRWGDFLPSPKRWWLVVAAILGAAVGSKILYWLSDPYATWDGRADFQVLIGGKTIVGGVLGGWLAVEWAKRRLGIVGSTGDLFAVPLCVGLAIGRVGCFLTGLADNTHGLPTGLPWGVDFGDGIPRHPTQLYEIGFVFILGAAVIALARTPHNQGDLFKTFMIGFLGFRFLLDFIKPTVSLLGLSAIQWACLAALAYYLRFLPALVRRPEAVPNA